MATTSPISVTSPPGLVSILLPCAGMLDYTKLCVPSVLRYSREPFELIFLDIGDKVPNECSVRVEQSRSKLHTR